MGRLLVLALLVLVAFWLVRRALAGARRREPPAAGAPQGDLVPCARCGVHLPRSEARAQGGALYCSDEHARLGPRER